MLKKRCISCGILKDVCEFSKHRTRKDGLEESCKECRCIKAKRYREEHKEQIAKQKKRYRQEHQEEIAAQLKKYYEEHKSESVKYRHAHQEEITARQRRYRQEHQEEIRKYMRRYCQTQKGKAILRRNCQKRRARKNNCEGSISAEEWNRVLKNQNNRCNVCGKKFTAKRPATMDHIVPVKHHGDHNSDNIQSLCSQCNSSKNAKFDPHYIQTWAYL